MSVMCNLDQILDLLSRNKIELSFNDNFNNVVTKISISDISIVRIERELGPGVAKGSSL